MKIATIPRKPKATANGKHKCNIPYNKKVGWPENHKKVTANKKAKLGEQTFADMHYVLDDTKNAKCGAERLKDFNKKVLTPNLRKKSKEIQAKPKKCCQQ